MSLNTRWYNWPRTASRPCLAPWYVISWRLLWAVPILASFAIFLMCYLISHGRKEAVRLIDDLI